MSKVISYDVTLNELTVALEDRVLSKDELNKLRNSILGGEKLKSELEDTFKDDVDKSVHISLKSNGIYIQTNRDAKRGESKVWTFLVRIPIWGGGDISAEEWLKISELAEKYSRDWNGNPSIRLTTRQAIQFHGVEKKNLIKLVHELLSLNRSTINACGDNTRNPLACVHHSDIFDGNKLAQKTGKYFELDLDEHAKIFSYPNLKGEIKTSKFKYLKNGLPRKFKIAFSGLFTDYENGSVTSCNCTDILTNDVGVAPLVLDNNNIGFQVYIGGGLGQKNGKITFPALGSPLGIFDSEEELMLGLDGLVSLQQNMGDRKNRHWARFKNLIVKKGLEISGREITDILHDKEEFEFVQNIGVAWVREQLGKNGINLKLPKEINLGLLNRHHGFSKQPDGRYSYGLWIENGRITDFANQGRIKTNVDKLIKDFDLDVRLTPYQDLYLTNINAKHKNDFTDRLKEYDLQRFSPLRQRSLACVGLPTCGLAVADSERLFDPLFTELEALGIGNVEGVNIGISGCERHCSRNVRFDISIEGKGSDLYQIKLLFGKPEDNYLASDIIYKEEKYLRQVPGEKLSSLINLLVQNYINNKVESENSISEFHKRIGTEGIMELINADKGLSILLEKKYDRYLV